MGLYHDGILQKQYVVSTSKFGVGDQPNSYCTPTGKCEVIAKIGHGLPAGAVLKSRHWNGEVLKPNAPGRDPIVSRILWLRGLESSNRNAMRRYIYIHGTTEENRLGQPASYGCIRMGMKDVVDVFNDVNIGAKVVVTKEHLPGLKKVEQVKEEPAVPAATPVPVTPPVETPTLAAATANAPKATDKSQKNTTDSTVPVPVSAEPTTKSSLFSFLPWSRGKSKTAESQQPLDVSSSNQQPVKNGSADLIIGPEAPLANGKLSKDKSAKVSTTAGTTLHHKAQVAQN